MSVATQKVDFFIAGNSKSGTSALYQFLKQHPQIGMCQPKEPNFFAEDFLHDQPVGAFTRKTLAQYLHFFPDEGGKLWGDASACYLYSGAAARGIHLHNPKAKIIVMLREPVDFIHSYHLQMLKNPASEGERIKDLKRALMLEEVRKQGKKLPRRCLIPALLYYRERVKYAAHLQRFLQYFERERVKVIIYDDFRADNRRVLREVLAFLGVDPSFEPQFGEHNCGIGLRSKSLQMLMHNLTHGKGLFSPVQRFLKRALSQRMRKILIRSVYHSFVFRPKPELDHQLRANLMQQFKGEVEELSSLLGRDLVALWKYDTLSTACRDHAQPPARLVS